MFAGFLSQYARAPDKQYVGISYGSINFEQFVQLNTVFRLFPYGYLRYLNAESPVRERDAGKVLSVSQTCLMR